MGGTSGRNGGFRGLGPAGRVCAWAAAALALLQAALVLVSWVAGVLAPQAPVRSVLGGEGARWLFGTFVSNVLSPPLAWLVMLGMAWGCVAGSGLPAALGDLRGFRGMPYRRRQGLMAAAAVLALSVAVLALLALAPHAMLLGVGGTLFPSAFIRGLVPALALVAIAVSVAYGATGGTFDGLSGVFGSLCLGLGDLAPLMVVYVLAAQLYRMVLFVFR